MASNCQSISLPIIDLNKLPWMFRNDISNKMNTIAAARLCATEKNIIDKCISKNSHYLEVERISAFGNKWRVTKRERQSLDRSYSYNPTFEIEFDNNNAPMKWHNDSPISIKTDIMEIWGFNLKSVEDFKEMCVNSGVKAKQIRVLDVKYEPKSIMEFMKITGADELEDNRYEIVLEPEFHKLKKFCANIVSWDDDYIKKLRTPCLNFYSKKEHLGIFAGMMQEWSKGQRILASLKVNFNYPVTRNEIINVVNTLGATPLRKRHPVYYHMPYKIFRYYDSEGFLVRQLNTDKPAIITWNLMHDSFVFCEVPNEYKGHLPKKQAGGKIPSEPPVLRRSERIRNNVRVRYNDI